MTLSREDIINSVHISNKTAIFCNEEPELLKPLAESFIANIPAFSKANYENACSHTRKIYEYTNELYTFLESYKSPTYIHNPTHIGRIRNNMDYIINSTYDCKNFIYQLERNPPMDPPAPSLLIDEFSQIIQEFEGFIFSIEAKLISVITKPITLTDTHGHSVDLGQFEIMLHYLPVRTDRRLYNYKIFALAPYYPLMSRRGGHSSLEHGYPHPHMHGTRLCEGEAAATLTNAIQSSRLCDFFLIINSTLNTYNPHSPFYKLEDWELARCVVCGELFSEGLLTKCTYCNELICNTCLPRRTCSICGKHTCGYHTGLRNITYCSKCGEFICMRHYKSIRKHKCFGDVKKEQEQLAQEHTELSEQLETAIRTHLEEATTNAPEMIQESTNNDITAVAQRLDLNEEELEGPRGWVTV